MTRAQAYAVVSAALIVAVLGLGLVLALHALRADEFLAQVASAAMHGQLQMSRVMNTMSETGNTAQLYLSK